MASHSRAGEPSSHASATALTEDDVAQALPLIQSIWPGVNLADWRNFAQCYYSPLASGATGILALRDATGTICGVVAHALGRDLRAGAILQADLFAASDLANSRWTVQALLDATDAQAASLGCSELAIRISKEQARLALHLSRLDFTSERVLFWKRTGLPPIRS